MPRVTVIVPIFNGTAYLPAFFDSLNGALPEGSEVILVDDASTERVWETVPELPAAERVVSLKNENNVGYASTVNRGFRAAEGDIVMVLNTDLVLQPDCIDAAVALIQRERRVGIVGSRLIYPSTGLVQHVGLAFGIDSKTHVYLDLPSSHPVGKKTREVQVTTGAITAMTSSFLNSVGPFDEGYFNCNEDIDHCLRAGRLGFRNFVCGDSEAHHWESKSGPSRFARVMSGEAKFWSLWGDGYTEDLGRFIDEALDHVVAAHPHLSEIPFHVLDLTRSPDRTIALASLQQRWPQLDGRVRAFGQMNNGADRLWLPLLLPHWVQGEGVPFIYLVDRYRELEENHLWFESRSRTVADELVVDLTGVVLHTSETSWLPEQRAGQVGAVA